ncbi:glycoside hydrolase family 97 protein [Novosphingobium sp. SG720]|uniref:glycoside hydrolase family 97 protein n=1 Tax=Novosphingobium sp. SG720 TaxID=2586998 RepID=UPI0014451EF2|nr:glycoside hydrolase family 97 protein [Novosphingobium sp. SG720]NKJ45118.1 alpha-glucosidase [Novosphingobium sp. SG720]
MTGATRRGFIAGVGALPAAAAVPAAARMDSASARIVSPDGQLAVTLDASGPTWAVDVAGRVIVAPSPVALLLADGGRLGPGAVPVRFLRQVVTGAWNPAYGIRASYDQGCSELMLEMHDPVRDIRFALVARAYDSGAAVRIRLLSAPKAELALRGEETEVRLPADAVVYASRDEGEYQHAVQTRLDPVPHPELTSSSDHGALADIPLTAVMADGAGVLVTESDRRHYPRTMFRSTAQGVVTHLMRYPGRATGWSGPGDTPAEESFSVPVPFATPWRVAVVAPEVARLVERQDLIPTLASPNELGDTAWVKPGRLMRIRDYTTQAGIDTIDFAAQRKLDYVMWDAHWYGDGTDPSDATHAIPAIDIERVIAHARAKRLGMILYVDRVPAMRQLDAIVKTYRDWGVAGIKFGFVWEGRQSDVDFIEHLLRTCGEHRLMVNLHDNLRPAGLERTLPNYIALEGVRGNEQFPTATHNCTLAYTRALAGPIDYTICYANPKNKATNAHQMALAAIYYNPLTSLYWYDKPDKYAGRPWPELAFLDECPTSWKQTVSLGGKIGEHAAVARQAHDGRWFVGVITNEQARTRTIALDFLGGGRWRLRRFADGPAAAEPWATPVVLSTQVVDARSRLAVEMVPAGGQALIFEPL